MSGTRRRSLACVVGCLIVIVVSMVVMMQRLIDHNRARPRERHVFQTVTERHFRYAGLDVSFIDEGEPGREAVVVAYGPRSERLVVPIQPMNAQLPGLLRHQDWLRVLRVVTLRNPSELVTQKLDAGEDRLVIVSRRPLLGPDPRSGTYAKKEWAFDFLELKPDGAFAEETWKYPHNRAGRERKEGELPQGSWQENAAIMLMPTFQAPNSSFAYEAVRAMGWTLPAAGLAGVGLTLSLAWMVAPSAVSRREQSGRPSAAP
jgi:hypothetical protein